MGACVTKNSPSNINTKKDLFKSPQDTQLFNPLYKRQLRNLKFQGTLSNLKIEGDVQEPYAVHFSISDKLMKAEFCQIQPEDFQKRSIKWKIKLISFKFSANEYQIRKKYLEVKIFKNNNQILQCLKINLYKILTGPVKYFFKIDIGNGKYIRLAYDLNIFQVLKIQVKVKKAQLFFKNEFPGQNFNFTLEWIISQNGKNSRKITTRPSSSMCTPIKKPSIYQDFADDHEQPVSIYENKIKKKLSYRNIEKQDITMSWANDLFLPQISFNITVEELNTTHFWFHCWKINNSIQQGEKQVMFRFANFRMALNELFEIYKQKSNEINQNSSNSTIQITQQIWSNGIIVGNCKINLQIKIPEFLKQIHGWTMTQKGIVNMYFQSYQLQGQQVNCQSFEKIQSLYQKLLGLKNELMKKIQSYFRKKQILKQGISLISKICQQLKNIGFNPEIISNNIEHIKQLCQKQLFFLQIMSTAQSLLTQNDNQLVENCWILLILLLKRGQLQLKAVGFNKEQRQQLHLCQKNQNMTISENSKGSRNKEKYKYHIFLKKKVKIGIQFQRKLYNCLTQSLISGSTFVDDNQNKIQNCQIFKGYCFVRISIFRKYILDKIVHNQDVQYHQFQIKQRQWLKSGIQIKVKQNQLLKELQWEDTFYEPLQECPESQESNEQLKVILQNSVWIEQIEKRQTLFFHFFNIIMRKYAQIQFKHKVPKYQYFSGYNKLVAAFLNQMKDTSLLKYSNSLIKSSMILLKNQDLQQPILLLIAKKTNYYDSSTVLRCLSIYRIYIRNLTQGNNLLSASFCYGVFTKIIKTFLDSESVNCVAATLMIIYEAYEKFQTDYQSFLTLYLLGNKFVKLFYHWSYVVRSVFHHLFILKIAQNKQMFNTLETRIQKKLSQSYIKVLTKLNCFQKQLLKQSSIKNDQKYNNKSYHQRMKYKLWKRKQDHQTLNHKHQNSNIKNDKNLIFLDKIKIKKKELSAMEHQSINQFDMFEINWPKIFDWNKIKQLINQKTNMHNYGLNMMKSQTMLEQEDNLPQELTVKSFNKQYTYHQTAKYHGAFFQHQFNLSHFTNTQKNQIYISHKEFQTINMQIRNKFIQTHQLPCLPQQTYSLFDISKIIYEEIQFFNY